MQNKMESSYSCATVLLSRLVRTAHRRTHRVSREYQSGKLDKIDAEIYHNLNLFVVIYDYTG